MLKLRSIALEDYQRNSAVSFWFEATEKTAEPGEPEYDSSDDEYPVNIPMFVSEGEQQKNVSVDRAGNKRGDKSSELLPVQICDDMRAELASPSRSTNSLAGMKLCC